MTLELKLGMSCTSLKKTEKLLQTHLALSLPNIVDKTACRTSSTEEKLVNRALSSKETRFGINLFASKEVRVKSQHMLLHLLLILQN